MATRTAIVAMRAGGCAHCGKKIRSGLYCQSCRTIPAVLDGRNSLPPSPAATDLVDELTYRNYAHNRRLSPEIEPAQWARIFDGAETMERRYQEETR